MTDKIKSNLGDIEESITRIANEVVSSAHNLMRTAKSEEDLRIGFEKILDPILTQIGVSSTPKYERFGSGVKIVYRGRPDAVHGQVIIEYEPPHAFSSQATVQHAYEQLAGDGQKVGYLQAATEEFKTDFSRVVGIGFDGDSIFFAKYRGKTGGRNGTGKSTPFVLHGPYAFDAKSARTFLSYLRGLARLPLTADSLAERFGPKSKIATLTVSAFADALEHWGNDRVQVFFKEWKRLFGIVYGEQFSSHLAEEAQALATLYNTPRETDFQELLFSVHTYFALLMKFIAAELITLKETSFNASYTSKLIHLSKKELLSQLTDIEDGGIYAKRGVTNFLEGDFFRWYLDAFSSPRLEEAIREIARVLSEFEPATTIIDPDSTRDLLKKLYQYLVPQEVRHRLGEYYTPDWLAELVLDEVGYDGNTLKRVLDPACGSGTFLVLAIQRAKDFGTTHKEPPLETAKRIAANVWGFDLNPLAVIASRTNYLFALGDLVNELEHLEIPIYLADSVLTPTRTTGNLFGEFLEVPTSVATFQIPAIWVQEKGFLLARAAPVVEEMARQQYETDEAISRFKREGLVFPPHEQVVQDFYTLILKLEKEGRDGIWARFLKNAFAPMIAGQFDFVVGNPPWIRWGYLSDEYRKATLPLWQKYGLFSLKGHAARLGGGEKDFSMLFTYAATDYYLKDKAKLGFLITQEVFKSKGAGEGFRQFRLGSGSEFKVFKAHDLVSVQPFEGAANKTAAIFIKKGERTTYPLDYTVWSRKKGVGRIPTDALLDEAQPLLQKKKLSAQPMGSPLGSWQTISEGQKELGVIEGQNVYQARRGASTEPYGVFWVDVQQVLSENNLLIRNLVGLGKRKIQQVEETIESDLVYPAVSGADIQRWYATPRACVILSQDPQTSEPYPESVMKSNWPRTYGYLVRFREALLSRGSKIIRQLAERTAFYAMFGIGLYTVARYKVVWKRMASDIVAAVISQYKTPFGYKTIIPSDTTALFAAESEDEAHYLCSIINSPTIREFIKSYSSAGRGFGAPSVMQHVGIPKFDVANELHKKLAEISKKCHKLKAEDNEVEVENLEKENDNLVHKLYGLTQEEIAIVEGNFR